jgi:hypothetical protein
MKNVFLSGKAYEEFVGWAENDAHIEDLRKMLFLVDRLLLHTPF